MSRVEKESRTPPAQCLGVSSKIEQSRMSQQLPSPKGVALTILELCRKEEANMTDLAHVVQTDPALSARLLRLANAAASGSGRPVAAVPDAVMRLGMGTVRQVAVGFSLVDQYLSGPCQGFDYDRFWSHSLLMGVAMQALATVSHTGAPDELFACGLMARIGCLALATVYPVEYADLLARGGGEETIIQMEHALLELDHNDYTAAILRDCGMPEALVAPVYYHESPDRGEFPAGSRSRQVAHLLYKSKRIADMALAGESERADIVAELLGFGEELELEPEALNAMIDQILDQWRTWSEMLNVKSGRLPPFATLAAAPEPKVELIGAARPDMRVLLVEEVPMTRQMMEVALQNMMGCRVHVAESGEAALALAVEVLPQVIVTDWKMSGMGGAEFCHALRATEWGQSIYVIMLTSHEAEEELVAAFEAGVDDYILKPVNLRTLRARMHAALHYVRLLEAWERDRLQLKQFAAELAISNRKLEHHAMTDLLTGLPNRRAGMDRLGQAWSAANRFHQGLAVMMLDIDGFKRINDSHGHAAGDCVLTEVGRLIRDAARKEDHVSRIGGEEFLVICLNADMKSTVRAAERLRQTIEAARIQHGATVLRISISIGVASKEAGMAEADGMVIAADRALYAAKQKGRNRTCVALGGKLYGAPHADQASE